MWTKNGEALSVHRRCFQRITVALFATRDVCSTNCTKLTVTKLCCLLLLSIRLVLRCTTLRARGCVFSSLSPYIFLFTPYFSNCTHDNINHTCYLKSMNAVVGKPHGKCKRGSLSTKYAHRNNSLYCTNSFSHSHPFSLIVSLFNLLYKGISIYVWRKH